MAWVPSTCWEPGGRRASLWLLPFRNGSGYSGWCPSASGGCCPNFGPAAGPLPPHAARPCHGVKKPQQHGTLYHTDSYCSAALFPVHDVHVAHLHDEYTQYDTQAQVQPTYIACAIPYVQIPTTPCANAAISSAVKCLICMWSHWERAHTTLRAVHATLLVTSATVRAWQPDYRHWQSGSNNDLLCPQEG